MGAAKTKEVKGAVSIHNNRQSKRLVLDRRRSCLIEGQLDKRIIIFTHRSLCNSTAQAVLYLDRLIISNHELLDLSTSPTLSRLVMSGI